MDCPECGGPLDAYVLDGREASICERCGWVGIEADHRGEGRRTESWNDALHRFYERHVETGRRRSDLPPVAAASDGSDDESVRDTDESAGDEIDEAAEAKDVDTGAEGDETGDVEAEDDETGDVEAEDDDATDEDPGDEAEAQADGPRE